MENKISIIGYGFIGKIIKQYYPEALVYDIAEKSDSLDDVLSADIIFIAFNLKDNGFNSLDSLIDYMKKAPGGRLFIIKSTFIPGTTDKIQEMFPQHNVIYSPEFLTEATAWEDFSNPVFQILGVPHKLLGLVEDKLFEFLPRAPIKSVMSPKAAEITKHALNSYFSMKVIFFNQLFDACNELGADYESVRKMLTQHPWVGDSHSVIFHKGYRGFGTPEVSKCLPKDTLAFTKVVKIPLLEKVLEINKELYGK